MNPGRLVWITLLTGLCSSSGCAQALLGGDEYVEDGEASGAGGGTSGNGTLPAPCEGGPTACATACIDLQSDPQHCGACGHDCLGAACRKGMCEPLVVASGLVEPQAIAVDDSHVYWTTAGGAVRRAPKVGGAVETLTEEQDSPSTIVVDDKRAFWLNAATGAVMRQSKDGGGKPKLLSNGTGARGLAQDDASIYFCRKVKKGDVRVVQKMGGGPVTLAVKQSLPADLHVRGDTLFWSGFADAADDDDDDDDDDSVPGGYVRSMPRLGGADVTTLALGEGEIFALTSLDDIPIWADRTNERIRAFSPEEGGPVTFVADQDVRGLTADATAIYWSTAGGNVKSRTLTGPVEIVALDISKAGPVLVDATHVYILRTGPSGAVLRVAK